MLITNQRDLLFSFFLALIISCFPWRLFVVLQVLWISFQPPGLFSSELSRLLEHVRSCQCFELYKTKAVFFQKPPPPAPPKLYQWMHAKLFSPPSNPQGRGHQGYVCYTAGPLAMSIILLALFCSYLPPDTQSMPGSVSTPKQMRNRSVSQPPKWTECWTHTSTVSPGRSQELGVSPSHGMLSWREELRQVSAMNFSIVLMQLVLCLLEVQEPLHCF